MKIPRKLKKTIKKNILFNLPKKEFKSKHLRIMRINKKENTVRYMWIVNSL